jgi:hypothetical protein
MSVDRQNNNSISFHVKVLDNSNYKKIKDIFIRKQDIYLIKLLAKKSKNNKRIENLKSYQKAKIYKELKLHNPPITNKNKNVNKLEFKNIRIIKKKSGNLTNEKNYIVENIVEESKNDKNTFNLENLITSKIYNSDISRNNQTMLNVKTEDTNTNNGENNNEDSAHWKKIKKNRLKEKFNKTATNLFNQNTIYNISKTPNILLPKTIKSRVVDNQKKLENLLYDNLNSDKFNYNKIILTDDKSESKKYNVEPYLKLKSNEFKFNKFFNLFSKDKDDKKRRQKIILKSILYENSERNNQIKNDHSLNKINNINKTSFDILNNGLPFINRK